MKTFFVFQVYFCAFLLLINTFTCGSPIKTDQYFILHCLSLSSFILYTPPTSTADTLAHFVLISSIFLTRRTDTFLGITIRQFILLHTEKAPGPEYVGNILPSFYTYGKRQQA